MTTKSHLDSLLEAIRRTQGVPGKGLQTHTRCPNNGDIGHASQDWFRIPGAFGWVCRGRFKQNEVSPPEEQVGTLTDEHLGSTVCTARAVASAILLSPSPEQPPCKVLFDRRVFPAQLASQAAKAISTSTADGLRLQVQVASFVNFPSMQTNYKQL